MDAEPKINLLRQALKDEIEATGVYDSLIKAFPQYKNEILEIRNDEINHQGRLMDMILEVDKTQTRPFEKGLEHKEVSESRMA